MALVSLKLWSCNWLAISLRKRITHDCLNRIFIEEKEELERDRGRGERQRGGRRKENSEEKKMEGKGR